MNIDSISLHCSDLAVAAQFYAQLLALPILETSEDHLDFSVGRSRLRWILDRAQQPIAYTYHVAFNIPENQLAAAKSWLGERTPLLMDSSGNEEFHSNSWDTDGIYFADPFGNILELIAHHALANSTSMPFSPDQFLNISEIGLPVVDVATTIQQLRQQLGIDVFHDTISPDFAALGTDEGLLIVVQQGREWYPQTGVYAVDRPLEVHITDSNGRQHILK